eukprot:TRINITY_DN1862_c0_g1_i3.p3 TRINITY_DN1862_c0_g1~~TRINITY_DN1862_c0_g1_i3.p3  ORF type:complete len:210 (+),score=37.99 TRINITY_DN1862_c0_g1_i3:385-1014(+)
MEVLRQCAAPIGRRVGQTVAAPGEGHPDISYLTPAACHTLLVAPGVAAALVEVLLDGLSTPLVVTAAVCAGPDAASTRAAVAAARRANRAAMPPYSPSALAAVVAGKVLIRAMHACRCADEALLPLLAGAVGGLPPQFQARLKLDPWGPEVLFCNALEVVLAVSLTSDADPAPHVPGGTPACVGFPPLPPCGAASRRCRPRRSCCACSG